VARDKLVLDDAIGASLRGPHRPFAVGAGVARCYDPTISPLASIGLVPGPEEWAALDPLPVDTVAITTSGPVTPSPVWRVQTASPYSLMTDDDVEASALHPSIHPLSQHDIDDMLTLVGRTHPGPFLPATIVLGGYLGIRGDGELLAMAGRRSHPPGWIEISAVCTHPMFQRRGLGRRLVLGVVSQIREEGEGGFLYAARDSPAENMYLRMGFRRHADLIVTILQRTRPNVNHPPNLLGELASPGPIGISSRASQK
jgi:GNAT superfamily N-acetyltransferase